MFRGLGQEPDLEGQLGVVAEPSHVDVGPGGLGVRVVLKLAGVAGGVVRGLAPRRGGGHEAAHLRHRGRGLAHAVGQLVSPQVAVTPEHFATLVTLVRLVVRVCEEVCLQVGALVEAALTHRTLVRGLLHVQNFVNGQSAGLAESLATV